ncbi:MAG: hypothetical protein HZB44_06685 [Actinobacteria bacterium]|nr:hypothetical protein [Actinomycetota bacterium]
MTNGYPKITLFIALAMVLSAAMVSGFGCGDSGDYSAAPGEEFSLEAGADISASGQEAGVADSGAVGDADVFTAADLPLGAGSELVFVANTPGTDTQVIFDLEGPWDFTFGAKQATLTVSMQPAESGYSSASYPEAQIAARSSWSPSPDRVEYNFQSLDSNYWSAYGRSDEEGRVVTFTSPSRAMMFPMAVGDSWIDSYSESADGHMTDITAEITVLAKNQLTVPAGSFEAFLVQTKVTAKPRSRQATSTLDYTWFVPGIGRVAEIISLPDEKNEVFGAASAFYRLESSR